MASMVNYALCMASMEQCLAAQLARVSVSQVCTPPIAWPCVAHTRSLRSAATSLLTALRKGWEPRSQSSKLRTL